MGRLIASLLFGITPANPVVLAAAGLILGVVAAIAALIPAWRASSVNPVNALRAE
jgi:ABC-type lipoprotein release transport system permease subunit